MARTDPLDYDPFEDEADYSVLLAAADKTRADGKIAVFKAKALDSTAAMLERANEITSWRMASSGAVGR